MAKNPSAATSDSAQAKLPAYGEPGFGEAVLEVLREAQEYFGSPRFIDDAIAHAREEAIWMYQDSAWNSSKGKLPKTSAARPVIEWIAREYSAGSGVVDSFRDFRAVYETNCLVPVGKPGEQAQYAIRAEAAEQIAKDMGIAPNVASHGIGVVADLLNRAEAVGFAKYVLENSARDAGITVSPDRRAVIKELKAHGIPRPY